MDPHDERQLGSEAETTAHPNQADGATRLAFGRLS